MQRFQAGKSKSNWPRLASFGPDNPPAFVIVEANHTAPIILSRQPAALNNSLPRLRCKNPATTSLTAHNHNMPCPKAHYVTSLSGPMNSGVQSKCHASRSANSSESKNSLSKTPRPRAMRSTFSMETFRPPTSTSAR